MEFKWADSETVYDEMEDFYCDGDAAPLGRMNYVFQNYVKGVSEIVYPDPNAAPETEAPTEEISDTPETLTEAPTDAPAESETQPAKKGCGSALTSSFAALTLIALCGAALGKKKD